MEGKGNGDWKRKRGDGKGSNGKKGQKRRGMKGTEQRGKKRGKGKGNEGQRGE